MSNSRMAKKVVLKLEVDDVKDKQKAMKAVSTPSGIESLAIDMKEKKMTVVGDVDPVEIVSKLKKAFSPQILTVGPAKEPEKKDAAKEEEKKDEKNKPDSEKIAELLKLDLHNPYHNTQYYPIPVYSADDNPNSCLIS